MRCKCGVPIRDKRHTQCSRCRPRKLWAQPRKECFICKQSKERRLFEKESTTCRKCARTIQDDLDRDAEGYWFKRFDTIEAWNKFTKHKAKDYKRRQQDRKALPKVGVVYLRGKPFHDML